MVIGTIKKLNFILIYETIFKKYKKFLESQIA
jgi:hypothetical protein